MSVSAQVAFVGATGSATTTVQEPAGQGASRPLRRTGTPLRLAPRRRRQVSFSQDTVDNEHMGRRSSKSTWASGRRQGARRLQGWLTAALLCVSQTEEVRRERLGRQRCGEVHDAEDLSVGRSMELGVHDASPQRRTRLSPRWPRSDVWDRRERDGGGHDAGALDRRARRPPGRRLTGRTRRRCRTGARARRQPTEAHHNRVTHPGPALYTTPPARGRPRRLYHAPVHACPCKSSRAGAWRAGPCRQRAHQSNGRPLFTRVPVAYSVRQGGAARAALRRPPPPSA
eukprot:scaffold577_cov405-Prasinococcus_capsulatus_cf.AAC.25